MPFQEGARWDDLFVPPTFASAGLSHVRDRLCTYRQTSGTAVVLPALVGRGRSEADQAQVLTELRTLVGTLAPYADGFVWLPALTGWQGIWDPTFFRQAAAAMRAVAQDRLLLVEMLASDEPAASSWLDLVRAFVDGGGNGIVAVGGRWVGREQLPSPTRWPFEAAIRCGASLADSRQAAIETARRAFPDLFIAACGGFHSRDEAFRACEYANVIVENEAYTRYGPAMAILLLHKLVLRLKYFQRSGQIDSTELWAFQQARWRQLASMTPPT
jgi:hypothetical protein